MASCIHTPREEGDREDADSLEGLNFLEPRLLNPVEAFLFPSLRIDEFLNQAELGILNCDEFIAEAPELIERVKEVIARSRILLEVPESLRNRFSDLVDPEKQASYRDYHDRLSERLAWLEATQRFPTGGSANVPA